MEQDDVGDIMFVNLQTNVRFPLRSIVLVNAVRGGFEFVNGERSPGATHRNAYHAQGLFMWLSGLQKRRVHTDVYKVEPEAEMEGVIPENKYIYIYIYIHYFIF